eukprot:Trichotokara_eunicae@DN8813_c0_g1_i1.p1
MTFLYDILMSFLYEIMTDCMSVMTQNLWCHPETSPPPPVWRPFPKTLCFLHGLCPLRFRFQIPSTNDPIIQRPDQFSLLRARHPISPVKFLDLNFLCGHSFYLLVQSPCTLR